MINHKFGRNQNEQSKPGAHPAKEVPAVEVELRSICGKSAHPEYPLLRAGTDPKSRYPAIDFTTWIANKLTGKQFEDIAYLLVQLTRANPGLGFRSEYWHNEAMRLCNLDLRGVIHCDDDRAFGELHTALFIYLLHGSLSPHGLLIDDFHVNYLARTMCPYEYSVRGLEAKVKYVNHFIERMRIETKAVTTAWIDYATLDLDEVNEALQPGPPAAGLRATLQHASIGARQLFFSTMKDKSGQNHWDARPYGIDIEKAAQELVALGLGEFKKDSTYAGDDQVFGVKENIQEDAHALANWTDATKLHLSIALIFAKSSMVQC